MRGAAKGSIYRNEVTEAAVQALLTALARMQDPSSRPVPLDYSRPEVRGRPRPLMKQGDRAIDWSRDDSAVILARIRAADGVPGVLDEIDGDHVYLYDAHPEDALRGGRPGEVIARRDGAILRATVDGAVWIGHLKRKGDNEPTLKLPATMVLGGQLADVPEIPAPLWDESAGRTYRELRYEESEGVGYVHFAFYNGAMSTRQCERLAEAIRFAKTRPTRVIALMGGADFWSNGIHLNVIEASPTPADESWANINAIDDVAREILACDRHLTIAAMQGNAGAGGVFLALAADRVLARGGVVLNPHYRGMGNLFGSEYWTYLLPRRVGDARAAEITGNRLPIGAPQAAALGLIDEAHGDDVPGFVARVRCLAAGLAAAPDWDERIAAKRARRAADEAAKPLESYRAEELERMKLNFYGFDPSYHVARYHFVFKVPKSRTPLYLARHRAVTRPARAAA
jgi:putative two-component system hydrogenase maturation factor HypX/HoxX